MKAILLILFLEVGVGTKPNEPPPLTVTATAVMEFGSNEACQGAKRGLAELFAASKIDSILACGPYDIAKLEVVPPPPKAKPGSLTVKPLNSARVF